jgi:hypothetical protein
VPTPSPSSTTKSLEAKQSRRDLLRGFQAVIKAQEERGVATAVGRKVRWESRQAGRQSASDVEAGAATRTGNAANAQQVAENEVKVCLSTSSNYSMQVMFNFHRLSQRE